MAKIHYGWGVSLCGMLLLMCTNDFPSNVFASCLPYLRELGYFGYGLGGMISISILINRWFTKLHATALAVCCVGTGVSAIIFPPIIVFAAEHRSLGAAFRVIAWASLMTMLLVILIVRDTPEERNLRAFGAGTEAGPKSAKRTERGKRYDLPWWLRLQMLLALVMMGGVAMSATTHYAALFTSIGYSKEAAAASVSMLGICLTISKLIFGPVVDHWGGKRASGVFLLMLIIGNIFCCLSQKSPVFMYGGTALMGLGFAPASVGVSIYAENFSTEAYYPILLKNFQRATALGGIIFSAVPGKLYDLFGNYVISYWMFTAMLVTFSVILFITYYRTETKEESLD